MSPTRLLLAGLVVATPSCLVLDGFGDLEPAEVTTSGGDGAGGTTSSSGATSQTVGGGADPDGVTASTGSGGNGEGGGNGDGGSAGGGGSGGAAPIGAPTLVVPIGHTGDPAAAAWSPTCAAKRRPSASSG